MAGVSSPLEAIWGKAACISHDGKPIFSLHVHPDGTRLATAGGDGLVRLWDVEAVLADRPEAESLLAVLDAHTAPVNAVRFSARGEDGDALLASGSDDHSVVLWRRAAAGSRAPASFGSAPRAPDREPWGVLCILRGHTGDVADLAWAAAGRTLASASLDGSVRVWDLERLGGPAGGWTAVVAPTPIAVLEPHNGWAKGVAWDPLGRYLATQGDDRSVVVHEVRGWRECARVSDPFRGGTSRTFCRRLSFSPDGQFLACPHAYSKPAHVGAVLRRPQGDGEGWRVEYEFKGHRAPVSAMAFSPAIYAKPRGAMQAQGGAAAPPGKGKGVSAAPPPSRRALCACAVGSHDCSFSIWLTSQPRPLLVGSGVFEGCVNDAAWAADGLLCLFASLDGTVSHVRIVAASADFDVLSVSQARQLLGGMYGDPADATRGQDGGGSAEGGLDGAAQLQPHVEGPEQLANEAVMAAARAAAHGAQTGARAGGAARGTGGAAAQPAEQRGANGKRRITPQPISAQPPPALQPAGGWGAEPPPQPQQPGAPFVPPLVHATPLVALPAGGAVKRARHADGGAQCLAPPAEPHGEWRAAALRLLTPAREPAGRALTASFSLPAERDLLGNSGGGAGGADWLVLARAEPAGGGEVVSTVRGVRGGAEAWGARVGGVVLALVATPGFVALACADGTLHVLSALSGALRLPPLLLSGPLVLLHAEPAAALLCALTADGELRVWDCAEGSAPALLHRSSVLPVLQSARSPVLSVVSLLPAGAAPAPASPAPAGPRALAPLLLTGGGRAYVFSEALDAWALAAEPREQSELWSALPDEGGAHAAAPLRALHAAALALGPDAGAVGGAGSALLAGCALDAAAQRLENLRHIEGCMCAAAALCSPHEYASWAQAYALALAHGRDERRARELCEGLLALAAGGGDGSGGGGSLLGPAGARRLLAQSVLPALATNRCLQRLVEQYTTALRDLDRG